QLLAGSPPAAKDGLEVAAAPEQERPDARPVAKAKDENAQEITVHGRVVGPDGVPIAGVKLFVPPAKKDPPEAPESVRAVQVGTSGPDGTFRISFKNPNTFYGYVIAHADGFAVDWVQMDFKKPTEEISLQLAKDFPISGRLIDTEGKPVAGVTVSVD